MRAPVHANRIKSFHDSDMREQYFPTNVDGQADEDEITRTKSNI